VVQVVQLQSLRCRYSILFSAVPSFIFLIVGTFDGLVTFYGIAEFLFYFLSVLGIFAIRKEYKVPKKQRTYTFNPVIFCSLSFFICARGILNEPLQGVAIAAAFLITYLYYRNVFLPAIAT
jgi:amino acid transporter